MTYIHNLEKDFSIQCNIYQKENQWTKYQIYDVSTDQYDCSFQKKVPKPELIQRNGKEKLN